MMPLGLYTSPTTVAIALLGCLCFDQKDFLVHNENQYSSYIFIMLRLQFPKAQIHTVKVRDEFLPAPKSSAMFAPGQTLRHFCAYNHSHHVFQASQEGPSSKEWWLLFQRGFNC